MRKSNPIALGCLAVFLAQAGITLYIPALSIITKDLAGQESFAALTLSVFLLGMGVTMLWWGHQAARFGSKNALMGALLLYSFSNFAVVFATDGVSFLIIRAIQGVAAGGLSVMARVVLRDSFSGRQLTQALSWLSICFVVSIGVGQFLGALVLTAFGWESIFLLTAAASLILGLQVSRSFAGAKSRPRAKYASLKSYRILLQQPAFFLPTLAGGLGYGMLILFNAMAPKIFQTQHSWSALEYGLLGWPISAAYLVGAVLSNRLALKCSQRRLFSSGLALLATGAIAMNFVPMLVAHSAAALWLPYCLILIAQGVLYPLSLSIANAGSPIAGPYAMAMAGFVHQIIAAVCGLVASQLPTSDPSSLTLVCAILAAAACFAGHKYRRLTWTTTR